jgi:hypothetical protein
MLQSITQRKRYGQSNPVTAKLGEAAKVMADGISKLPNGASPLQQAAAAAAAAEDVAQQEVAAAEQRQAAAAAAVEAFPQPNAQQRAKAAAADAAAAAKAQESRRTTRGAEKQQQQPGGEQQQQLVPCGWSVHHLNAFILRQLFSGVVERSLTTRRGQVFDSILLLMGLAGELIVILCFDALIEAVRKCSVVWLLLTELQDRSPKLAARSYASNIMPCKHIAATL